MLEADGCARRADPHRRQLVREPDVPLPRRGADRGDGRDVPGRLEDRASSSSAGTSSRSTRSRRRTSCRYARQFRDALSMPLVLLGGINRLDTINARARRRLRVRADRPRAVARARAPARDAEGPRSTKASASTATSACRRSTPARAASWSSVTDAIRPVRRSDLGRLIAEVLLEVLVQVDDAALLGRRHREVREAGLVQPASDCGRSSRSPG